MASKAGPRALGTDGMDFRHREKIASHYKASSTYKSRIKYVSFLHLGLWLLMVLRLSVALSVLFGLRPLSFLQKLRLPRAEFWEYWWLASFLPAIFALFSLKRNRVWLMQQYILGTVLFGLAPVVYGIYDNFDDLLTYWQTREAKILFRGFPMVVLWNMFLTIALQIHVFGVYFGWQLIKAWKPKSDFNKKKAT